jgi:hypothetical protein
VVETAVSALLRRHVASCRPEADIAILGNVYTFNLRRIWQRQDNPPQS